VRAVLCYDGNNMVTRTVPTITALEAQGIANQFLSEHLPDRFLACRPHLDPERPVWHMPVVLTYAGLGSIGEVGEILLNASSAEVVDHTPFQEIRARARALYNEHRDAVEAPMP
jgi:hypothetical protein